MGARERLKRLRDLVHRLEQLPASAERDRVLAEVRARAVDVDTGETPRAMLEEDPVLPLVRPVVGLRAMPPPRRPRAPRLPPLAPAERPLEPWPHDAAEVMPVAFDPGDRSHLLWDDEPLPAEDPPTSEADTPPFRPWTQGLRG